MSVASKNPFALLDDDPSEPVAPQPKKETSAPAPAAQSQKPRSNASRGGKYYQRGGKPRESGAGAADEPAGDDGARRKFDGEGRGRGRGRGRGDRGRGRGGRGGDRLDRHSATGKTDSDKKVSQGWGADEGSAELKAEESGAADAANDWAAPNTAATADDAWGASAPATGDDPWGANGAAAAEGAAPAGAEGDKAEGGERRRREREPEEEDNTVSYEEYLAQKKEAEAVSARALEVRQANEGDEAWQSSLQALNKDEDEDAYFVGKTKSAPKARAKKEEKVYLEIDARFERPNRGRGRGGDRGRGEGRGRGRGRGGDRGGERGGERGGATRAPRSNGPVALNVDDESAFPSLS